MVSIEISRIGYRPVSTLSSHGGTQDKKFPKFASSIDVGTWDN
jgi:hypothetical protein